MVGMAELPGQLAYLHAGETVISAAAEIPWSP
jgi:hypothetical protein